MIHWFHSFAPIKISKQFCKGRFSPLLVIGRTMAQLYAYLDMEQKSINEICSQETHDKSWGAAEIHCSGGRV